MQAVEALCQLRCPEAILGLYAWCREVTGVKMAWVKVAVEAASGRSVYTRISHLESFAQQFNDG